MKLDVIKNEIQKVAEAISLVLGVDVTIVDEDMKRIAGTGIYKNKVGELIHGYSAFKKSMEDKKTLIIDDPRNSELCKACMKRNDCEELSEICCPIVVEDVCYGVIGLVIFDMEKKKMLSKNSGALTVFVEKMADLISGNMKAEIKSNDYNIEKERIAQVLNSIDRAVVSTDEMGMITSYNDKFSKVFFVENAKGKRINEVLNFLGDDFISKIKSDNRHTDYFISNKLKIKGVVNVSKIYYKNSLKGFVIDFVDQKDAIRNFNTMNMDYALGLDDIVGISSSIKKVKNEALKASQTKSTVLITGESGTGKEMFARAIHTHSDRFEMPFTTVNCAAIPGDLLESELFGYDEGAFTGAKRGGKLGIFEVSNRGTIFLDEIGDMSLHLQAKLLRALQEGEIKKVGGNTPVKVDVRIIAATNKDLSKLVKTGAFREDLYYRLNVIPIRLPSLRDRKEDIEPLVEKMVDNFSKKLGKKIQYVSNEFMATLIEYSWPGNIRELQNVIEYSISMSMDGELSDLELLKNRLNVDIDSMRFLSSEKNTISNNQRVSVSKIDDIEKNEIVKALELFKDYKKDKDMAARELGISKATLYRKIKKYNIDI